MKRLFICICLITIVLTPIAAQSWTNITTENTSTELPSDKVYALLFDKEGTLWAATDGGVSYLKDGKWSILPTTVPIAGKVALNLYIDSKENLWASTESNGLAMRDKEGKWIVFTDQTGLTSNLVQDIAEDAHGGYWVANGAALSYYKDGTWEHSTPSANPYTNMFTLAVNPTNGEVWAGSESALFRYVDKTWKEIPEAAAFGSIQDIQIVGDKVWVASQNGLQCFENNKWTTITTENGLPDNYLTSLSIDAENNLWIGTDGYGIVKQNGDKWTIIGTKDGLSSNDIFSIAFSSDQRPYIGTHLGGISYVGMDKKWHHMGSTGLIGNTIKDILFTNEDTWYGTSAGISRLSKVGQWKNYTRVGNQLPGNNVRRIMHGGDGKIWFAFYDGGLSYYIPETNMWRSFTPKPGELPGERVTSVVEAKDGHIWIPTFGGRGLAEFDGKSWKTYTEADGLPAKSFFSGTVALDGSIWFGSVAGVVIYKDKRFSVLNKANSNILNDNIRNVCFAADGSAYICTNAGLTIRSVDGTFTNHDSANGFISGYVNHVSFDDEGNKWISCWTEGFYLMTKSGIFHKIGQSFGFPATEATMSQFAKDGSLQIATNNGVVILKDPKALVSKVMGNQEMIATQQLKLYPNPARHQVAFSQKVKSCALYTITGILVCTASDVDNLSLSSFPIGSYVLRLDDASFPLEITR